MYCPRVEARGCGSNLSLLALDDADVPHLLQLVLQRLHLLLQLALPFGPLFLLVL